MKLVAAIALVLIASPAAAGCTVDLTGWTTCIDADGMRSLTPPAPGFKPSAVAQSYCKTNSTGFETCKYPDGTITNTPPQTRGATYTTADEGQGDSDPYGTFRHYSDGTYGYSMGNGQEWRERYKGDRTGVVGFR